MPRVVVGVDGSPGAVKALHWAAEEAKLRGAELTVVHAWHIPASVAMAAPVTPGGEFQVLEDAASSILDAMAEEASGYGVPVKPVLVQAYPAPALIEHSAGAILLVVGTRGRGGFTGLLLGSVSQEVAQHAPCPVVIVPPGAEE